MKLNQKKQEQNLLKTFFVNFLKITFYNGLNYKNKIDLLFILK
jgi:hypothetical protein